MKNFEYNNTNIQRDEIICYAYSLDVEYGSIKELKKFYNVLLRYFPHSEADGVRKPHEHSWDNTQQWHAARNHVASLMADRIASSRHWWMWVIGALTLAVLVWTLFDTINNRSKTVATPAPNLETVVVLMGTPFDLFDDHENPVVTPTPKLAPVK